MTTNRTLVTIVALSTALAIGCNGAKPIHRAETLIAAVSSSDEITIEVTPKQYLVLTPQECTAAIKSLTVVNVESVRNDKRLAGIAHIRLARNGSIVATLEYYDGSIVALGDEYFRLRNDPFAEFVGKTGIKPRKPKQTSE
jgi:hypothetical protein